MMEFNKIITEIEDKLGIRAYNELMAVFSKLYNKLEETQKSRDKWKDLAEEARKEVDRIQGARG